MKGTMTKKDKERFCRYVRLSLHDGIPQSYLAPMDGYEVRTVLGREPGKYVEGATQEANVLLAQWRKVFKSWVKAAIK